LRPTDAPGAAAASDRIPAFASGLLRAACNLYPCVRGRGAIANLAARFLPIPPGTVCRLRRSGPEIELLPGQFGSVVTWLFGIDEPREVAFFRRLVPQGGVVIDVGANIGQYTLLAAELAGPSGRVFAFEPDPVNAAALQRSVGRNGFGGRVELLRVAVAGRSGEAALDVQPDRTRSRLAAKTGESVRAGAVQVRTLALDDFLDERGLDRLDFLKIDVEGADLDVLRGAERTLVHLRPALMVEYEPDWLRAYGERPEALLGFLGRLGYGCRFVNSRGLFPHPPTRACARGGNLICLPTADHGADVPPSQRDPD
jgi:FkbM family methyltransferase